MSPLTQQELKELVYYDMETGCFTWLKSRGNTAAGSSAGHHFKGGYVRLSLYRKFYMAHRVAWFYVTGSWPTGEIDHIDGDEANNAWGNLREATRSQNNCNKGPYKNNRLGLKGVHQVCSGRFVAKIYINGTRKNLGSFDTPEEAHAAYCAAAKELFGEYRRAAA